MKSYLSHCSSARLAIASLSESLEEQLPTYCRVSTSAPVSNCSMATDSPSSAILWLQKQGVVHRDISRGNVLLAREEPTAFTEPRQVLANGKSILLCRRWPSQSPNVYGVLHDLDMAYFVPESNDAPVSNVIKPAERKHQPYLQRRNPPPTKKAARVRSTAVAAVCFRLSSNTRWNLDN